MTFLYSTHSEKGPRSQNQDSLAVTNINKDILVACIADGVGGNKGGQEASNLSTKIFVERLGKEPKHNLIDLIKDIHNQILLDAQLTPEKTGMATTFSGCIISQMHLNGVHSGDSRLMVLRGNGLLQLTKDQTEVARLFDEGLLSKEDAYNYPRKQIVENALGIEQPFVPQAFSFELKHNDRLVLTTDGVHNKILKSEIRDVSLQSNSPEELTASIIKLVKSRHPDDNFSILSIFID